MMPPTRCTPTTSSESSRPNLYFRPTAHAQTHAGDGPDDDRADDVHRATGRGDGDQSGDDTGRGTERGRLAVQHPLHREPAEHRAHRRDRRVHERRPISPWNWARTRPHALVQLSLNTIEPTLKPYQPNHSRPGADHGRASGCAASSGPLEADPRPMIRASTPPAMPALMCTTVPPA